MLYSRFEEIQKHFTNLRRKHQPYVVGGVPYHVETNFEPYTHQEMMILEMIDFIKSVLSYKRENEKLRDLVVDDPHAPRTEEQKKNANEWIAKKIGEVFEARFDGELAYAEGTLTVRVWCTYQGTINNPTLLALKKKFDEVMEIGHVESSGSEMKDIARMLSKMLGNATVELTTDHPALGRFGIVYYPEWP